MSTASVPKRSKGDVRRERILHDLQRQGRISVVEIIERYGCSEATARRDLALLAETEPIIRTLGGAHYEGMSAGEASFREKQGVLWEEKLQIAEKAASLVEEGDIVGLTGGTTTFLISKALKHKTNITVVTNAVNIAMELADSEAIQVVLTGGVMRSKSYELCGPLAESIVSHLHIGKMFVGIDGISIEQGLTTYSELEAEVDRAMIQRSKQVLAVFDHSKLNKTSLFTIAPLDDIHACITDRKLDQEMEQHLQKLQIDIHYSLEDE